MDNSLHSWTKVIEEAPMPLQHPLQNWVRGDSGYFNLDKFFSLKVETNHNPRYNQTDAPQEWAVTGVDDFRKHWFIKSYKKKEKAYKWLGDMMGGLQ